MSKGMAGVFFDAPRAAIGCMLIQLVHPKGSARLLSMRHLVCVISFSLRHVVPLCLGMRAFIC